MQPIAKAILWCWPFPPQTTMSKLGRIKALCPHLSSGSSGTEVFPRIVSIEVVAPLAVSPPIIAKAPRSVYLVRLGGVVVAVVVVVVIVVVFVVGIGLVWEFSMRVFRQWQQSFFPLLLCPQKPAFAPEDRLKVAPRCLKSTVFEKSTQLPWFPHWLVHPLSVQFPVSTLY